MTDLASHFGLCGRAYPAGFAAPWSEDVVFGSGSVRTVPTRPEKKRSKARGLSSELGG